MQLIESNLSTQFNALPIFRGLQFVVANYYEKLKFGIILIIWNCTLEGMKYRLIIYSFMYFVEALYFCNGTSEQSC